MKKQKVILFFPELLKNQTPMHIPLELISLVPGLKALNLEVIILDERVDDCSEATVKSHIKTTLFVGISSRPGGQVSRSFKFAKLIKSISPETPIVMGGWFPSIVPEVTLKHPAVDYVITGEGEIPVTMLAEKLIQGKIPDGIPGLAQIINNEIKMIPHKKSSLIHEYLRPDYSALDLEKYFGPDRELTYISSKGCNGSCNFCAIQCGYNGEWFPLDAERVLTDIRYLQSEYSIRKIRFVDANFFEDEMRTIAICKGLIEFKIPITWQAPGRIDQLANYSESTWELIAKSGCSSIETGVESGSAAMICAMQKEITQDDVSTFLKCIKHHNIAGTFNYILGYPNETELDLRSTLTEIMMLKAFYEKATFAIYRFSPIPITELFDELITDSFDTEDPEMVEHYKIYRLNSDQPWLDARMQHLIDMIFYYYLPYSLKKDSSSKPFHIRLIKNGLINLARKRIIKFNFTLPFEWWLLKLGTNAGILNRQRFRQWAQS